MKNNLEFIVVALLISGFFIITELMIKLFGSALSLVIIIGLIILVALRISYKKGGDK